MFKNKSNGKHNLCGENIRKLRLSYPTKLSQRGLADKMQLIGIDVDKNAIQRIECGKRFVTDIELKALAEIFEVSLDELVLVWQSGAYVSSLHFFLLHFYLLYAIMKCKSGFSNDMIQANSNKVVLDYSVHRKISGFYSSKPQELNGLRVRDWLAGQSFEFQTRYGWQVIQRYRGY